MSIEFPCENCGAPFEVSEKSAGKRGRCGDCGHEFAIPSHSLAESAGAAAQFRVEPAESEPSAPRRFTPKVADAPGSWVQAVNSRVGLVPLTDDELRKPQATKAVRDALADHSGSAHYRLADSGSVAASVAPPATPTTPIAAPSTRRRLVGQSLKVLRKLGNASYLLSMPFLFLIILGAITANRPLAILGATCVVLLNIGRLATGLLQLVLVPFRDGAVEGLIFLIPPFTFFYIAKHWARMSKPVGRVLEPALTVALVFLAFAFVPALSREGDASAGTPLAERLESDATELVGEMRDKLQSAKGVDLNRLRDDAQAKLSELEERGEGSGSARRRRSNRNR
jgi:hypothetical protein